MFSRSGGERAALRCEDVALHLAVRNAPITLPFAVALLVSAPVVLFLRGKLALVISAGLASRERFRDGKHNPDASFVSLVGTGECEEVRKDFACLLDLCCVCLIANLNDRIRR
jgi:hypothetical protein